MRLAAACATSALGAFVFIAATSSSAQAAQTPVALGTTDAFAVLAGAGITNTGPTTLNGDTGTFPTTTETGFNSITYAGGLNEAGDQVTQGAKSDLGVAYGEAAGQTPATSVPAELGGTTLLPVSTPVPLSA